MYFHSDGRGAVINEHFRRGVSLLMGGGAVVHNRQYANTVVYVNTTTSIRKLGGQTHIWGLTPRPRIETPMGLRRGWN